MAALPVSVTGALYLGAEPQRLLTPRGIYAPLATSDDRGNYGSTDTRSAAHCSQRRVSGCRKRSVDVSEFRVPLHNDSLVDRQCVFCFSQFVVIGIVLSSVLSAICNWLVLAQLYFSRNGTYLFLSAVVCCVTHLSYVAAFAAESRARDPSQAGANMTMSRYCREHLATLLLATCFAPFLPLALFWMRHCSALGRLRFAKGHKSSFDCAQQWSSVLVCKSLLKTRLCHSLSGFVTQLWFETFPSLLLQCMFVFQFDCLRGDGHCVDNRQTPANVFLLSIFCALLSLLLKVILVCEDAFLWKTFVFKWLCIALDISRIFFLAAFFRVFYDITKRHSAATSKSTPALLFVLELFVAKTLICSLPFVCCLCLSYLWLIVSEGFASIFRRRYEVAFVTGVCLLALLCCAAIFAMWLLLFGLVFFEALVFAWMALALDASSDCHLDTCKHRLNRQYALKRAYAWLKAARTGGDLLARQCSLTYVLAMGLPLGLGTGTRQPPPQRMAEERVVESAKWIFKHKTWIFEQKCVALSQLRSAQSRSSALRAARSKWLSVFGGNLPMFAVTSVCAPLYAIGKVVDVCIQLLCVAVLLWDTSPRVTLDSLTFDKWAPLRAANWTAFLARLSPASLSLGHWSLAHALVSSLFLALFSAWFLLLLAVTRHLLFWRKVEPELSALHLGLQYYGRSYLSRFARKQQLTEAYMEHWAFSCGTSEILKQVFGRDVASVVCTFLPLHFRAFEKDTSGSRHFALNGRFGSERTKRQIAKNRKFILQKKAKKKKKDETDALLQSVVCTRPPKFS